MKWGLRRWLANAILAKEFPRMIRLNIALLAIAGMFAQPHQAEAASSAWQSGIGVRIRLVTTGKPDGHGFFRGAVEVFLNPGWKTYWRDPGDAGVPPQMDFGGSRNVSVVKIDYPAPHRFSDAGGVWAGYKEPVRFGLTLKAKDPTKPMKLDATIFLGVCQSICVPFQAHLSLDPDRGADDVMDAAVVAETFAALPSPPSDDFQAKDAAATPTELFVDASLPHPEAPADLFVAAPEGYSFGPPRQLENRHGEARFLVPVLGRPQKSNKNASIPYTLVQGQRAVGGVLSLPRPR
jgi:DsbC/DsbD-like thiol-disulfide interchange protein